jgi:predicted acylesterase/phospholipase RssA
LLRCDVIFRGGITSGVVYPGTVAALSEKYRFVNIGGASAGAIAAGITAAAEYGWRKNAARDASISPFRRLADITEQMGGTDPNGTSLKKMFRPADRLRPLFDLMWRGLELKQSGFRFSSILQFVIAACGHFGWQLMIGAAVGVALFLVFALSFGDRLTGHFWPFVVTAVACVLIGLVAALVAVALRILAMVRNDLPANEFGLCPGIDPAAEQTLDGLRSNGALMDWMHATMQDLAGKTVGQVAKHVRRHGEAVSTTDIPDADRPLCMSDLWGVDGLNRDIDLVLTTTNLSQRLPHQFPFLVKAQTPLFFRPDELEKVLPADVVHWMVVARGAPKLPENASISAEYIPLPEPKDLPVLLGVRMSLSFPILISAVKLYALDAQAAQSKSDGGSAETAWIMRPCWFSDGGITSNFPISLFDAPLPTRPTFCINLRAANDAEEMDKKAGRPAPVSPKVLQEPGVEQARSPDPLVDMALRNSDDIMGRFGAKLDTMGVFGFLAAIVSTARNGRENELMLMPGYRDRIVHVATLSSEGGLNLSMSSAAIEELSRRGERAADMLISRFHPEGAAAKAGFRLGWGNQRWIRYRLSAAALEDFLAQFRATWTEKAPLGHAYPDILAHSDPDDAANKAPIKPGHRYTPSYKWQSASIAAAAFEATEKTAEVSKRMQELASQLNPGLALLDGSESGKGQAPRPIMALRLQSAGDDSRRPAPVQYGKTLPAHSLDKQDL